MAQSQEAKFNSLCSKYEIARQYEWLGFISEWKVLEGALDELKVSKLDQADFNVLWVTHPLRTKDRLPTLNSGVPKLAQNLSTSPPSVPKEAEHAPCNRIVKCLPFIVDVEPKVLQHPSTLWNSTSGAPGAESLPYVTEADVVFFVRTFFLDILKVLQIDLELHCEVSVQQIRPDICLLLLKKYIVGVVEVKKPGENILLQPTVLGELLDQMLVAEGFYSFGPILGILTTLEEWMVAWFPTDDEKLGEGYPVDTFSTPVKPERGPTYSPPGDTPTQETGGTYRVELQDDVEYSHEGLVHPEAVRTLCTTPVLSVREDAGAILQLLCSAFTIMSCANTNHRASLSWCYLKFHKDAASVTYHPASREAIYSALDFNKFPSSRAIHLIAVEDLGRGSTGKAWLCATTTTPRSAVCVLKYDNKVATGSPTLRSELAMWKALYPDLAHMVSIQHWSGSDALVMPHFSSLLEQERAVYREEVRAALMGRFVAKGKVHVDVRWRNIGKYRNRSGDVEIVVYDLHGVVDYVVDLHLEWIEKAMKALYPAV